MKNSMIKILLLITAFVSIEGIAGSGGHIGGGSAGLLSQAMVQSALGQESVQFGVLGESLVVRKADYEKILSAESVQINDTNFYVQSGDAKSATIVSPEGGETQVYPVDIKD